MNEKDKKDLFTHVANEVERWGVTLVERSIALCHLGQLDGVTCTNHNLHLFRQYRNKVTSNPLTLIENAMKG